MPAQGTPPPIPSLRARLHEVIFEADTPAGKAFDVVLLAMILLSVVAVMLESVDPYRLEYGRSLRIAEWVFTGLFTVEYLLRLATVGRPWKYATSFFGIVDLMAVVPTYLTLLPLGEGAQALIVIRALRLLRVFRVFKAARYVGEAGVLVSALRASRPKITVFLLGVLSLILILGSVMYLVEAPAENSGFTSIPQSVYWTIVTLTTVGYGDITPQTFLGRVIASAIMIIGYAIIAVPTGIVTSELAQVRTRRVSTQACPSCAAEGHDPDAKFCRICGAPL